jgi:hypothetical protein
MSEENSNDTPRPLTMHRPALINRLHRFIHTTPVEGCAQCEERAKKLAEKKKEMLK